MRIVTSAHFRYNSFDFFVFFVQAWARNSLPHVSHQRVLVRLFKFLNLLPIYGRFLSAQNWFHVLLEVAGKKGTLTGNVDISVEYIVRPIGHKNGNNQIHLGTITPDSLCLFVSMVSECRGGCGWLIRCDVYVVLCVDGADECYLKVCREGWVMWCNISHHINDTIDFSLLVFSLHVCSKNGWTLLSLHTNNITMAATRLSDISLETPYFWSSSANFFYYH